MQGAGRPGPPPRAGWTPTTHNRETLRGRRGLTLTPWGCQGLLGNVHPKHWNCLVGAGNPTKQSTGLGRGGSSESDQAKLPTGSSLRILVPGLRATPPPSPPPQVIGQDSDSFSHCPAPAPLVNIKFAQSPIPWAMEVPGIQRNVMQAQGLDPSSSGDTRPQGPVHLSTPSSKTTLVRGKHHD